MLTLTSWPSSMVVLLYLLLSFVLTGQSGGGFTYTSIAGNELGKHNRRPLLTVEKGSLVDEVHKSMCECHDPLVPQPACKADIRECGYGSSTSYSVSIHSNNSWFNELLQFKHENKEGW